MSSLSKAPTKSATKKQQTKSSPNHQPKPSVSPEPLHLSSERRAQIEAEARALGDNVFLFPGKLARRAAWSAKIHAAAERDAKDLTRAPFPDDEGNITPDEITAHGEQIHYLRSTQSAWRAVQAGQKKAFADFDDAAEEAAAHKETLLRFFALRYKNNADGQRWITDVRAGSGDADLLQDVSDILVRCEKEKSAIKNAPRGEAHAAARLAALAPALSRLLAAKSLTAEARDARKLRDGVYTLVINTERRLRAAAEYWYAGTDRLKDYAAFPASPGGSADEGDEEDSIDTEPAAPAATPQPTAP